jgi:hypothetical protein
MSQPAFSSPPPVFAVYWTGPGEYAPRYVTPQVVWWAKVRNPVAGVRFDNYEQTRKFRRD